MSGRRHSMADSWSCGIAIVHQLPYETATPANAEHPFNWEAHMVQRQIEHMGRRLGGNRLIDMISTHTARRRGGAWSTQG